jgi:hypothetical protein
MPLDAAAAAAFDKLVEKMSFYQDIVHTNQPFLQKNPARAQEIHDELEASPMNAANAPLRTKEEQKENLPNVEAFCIKEPKSLDEYVTSVWWLSLNLRNGIIVY